MPASLALCKEEEKLFFRRPLVTREREEKEREEREREREREEERDRERERERGKRDREIAGKEEQSALLFPMRHRSKVLNFL
jgi:hypothetical protein